MAFSAAGKAIGYASVYAPAAVRAAKKAGTTTLDYDFFGLAVKLAVYFISAFLFSKYIEACLFKDNFVAALLGFLNIGIPEINFHIGNPDVIKALEAEGTTPTEFKEFWENGIAGIKYWDIVKFIAIGLVIAEWARYNNGVSVINGKASPMVTGVFAIVIGFLLFVTVPELWQKFKEGKLFKMQDTFMESMK